MSLASELIENSPWSNDEITLRIKMCEEVLNTARRLTDDTTRIMVQREIATWKELIKRRQQQAPAIVTFRGD